MPVPRDVTKGGRPPHLFSLTEALKRLGRPVAFYPSLAKIIGLKEAILICQLAYWTPRAKNEKGEGWIYKSAQELENETGLTYKEQIRVRQSLIQKGLLEDTYDRSGHRLYFRIVPSALDVLIPEHTGAAEVSTEHLTKGKVPPDEQVDGIVPKVSSFKEPKTTAETTQKERDANAPSNNDKTNLHLEQVLLPWMEAVWRGHPNCQRRRWEDPKYPSSFERAEESEGAEIFRQAFVDYLDSNDKPNIITFLYSRPKPPARQRAKRSRPTAKEMTGLSDADRIRKILGRTA